ncbi:hypothetical protein GLOIN_2v1767205 [Rhizophagus irregularis DAOM 181602=DAOM 197198]|nr:hypothetical protein GLOIN_2v1767205 [Rhizophagus irregularis DAOM 181602=DAOM 197198]
MSINCCLNDENFAITILDNKQTHKPSFRCLCNGKDSGIQQSASATINNTYKQVFRKNKTDYSGMVVMGFDDEIIINKLLSDILFIPIFIRIDRILIVVSQIGISSHKGCYGAGPGFLSTLIIKYKGKQSLFVQSIEDNCNLDVYDGDINQYHNEGITPDEIWKSINILNKFDGAALFGITNSYVQQELDKLRNNSITCTSNDWNDIDKLNLIFRQQIKTRKIASPFSDWSKLFKNWYEQNNTIIQFPNILFQIYPANYQFQEKELGAWRAMFRASGMLLLVEKKSSFQPDSEGEILWKSLQEALKANKRGIDGKIRILSIIAENFIYKKLKEKLKVENDIVNSTQKHARLYGPEVPTLVKTKRTVKCMSEVKEKQFLMFFQDRSIVTQSSYWVNKNGLPILYMRDQKIKLWKKFEETFPNGMKKTSFMGRLANCSNIKYRDDIGGLCLTCNDYGYIPFESLIAIARNTFLQKDQLNSVLQKIDALKRHLRRGYERELVVNADGTTKHDSCISHCLPYAFGNCLENHNSRCSECDQFFEFFEFMHLHIKEDQIATLEETKEHLQYYLAHSTRKIYLNSQFKATLASLDEDGALFVANYKMRILPRFARETKAEFFGKRGWTLHTILMFRKKENCEELEIRAYDHWSTDTKQDAWFTASSFEAVFETIKHKPKWIRIMSDNGAHYHSLELMAIIAHWNEWYQIEVRDWQFLEPGEAKTTIDSHHAAVSILLLIAIYDVREGKDIVEAAKHLSGYICARSLPHFRPWNNFPPSTIAKLCTKPIVRPHPKISEQTEPESAWTIPIPTLPDTDTVDPIVPEFMDNNNENDELEDARNLNQKDKMLAKDMYNELMKFVESGELEAEDVPKITTIQNWISTYARTFKEQATENMIKDIRDENSL